MFARDLSQQFTRARQARRAKAVSVYREFEVKLDRAERLLLTICERKSEHQRAAAELLTDLYEQERDWARAIAVSARLVRTDVDTRRRVAHFHCELAEAHLEAEDLKSAMREANRSIELAPDEARGRWLSARIEFKQRHFKRALKHLRKTHELQPSLTMTVPVEGMIITTWPRLPFMA